MFQILTSKLKIFLNELGMLFKELPKYFIVVVLISGGLFFLGYHQRIQPLLFQFPLILWTCCMIKPIQNIKQSIFYITLMLTFFLFILSKPFFALIEWRNVVSYLPITFNGIVFSCFVSAISIFSMYLGYQYSCKKGIAENKVNKKYDIRLLRQISFVIIVVSFIPNLIRVYEIFIFMLDHTYLEYFSLFQSNMNVILKGIAQLFFPSVLVYLATFPSRIQSLIVLTLLSITSLGGFIAGTRSKLIIPLVFSFLYFFIREYIIEKQGKTWLNKKMIIVVGIIIPFMCVGLYLYNYIRVDIDINNIDMSNPITTFIDQQGTTFLVVGSGYEKLDEIDDHTLFGYTFGPIEDRLINNRVVRSILNIPDFSAQSKEALMYSRNFSHVFSYAILGDLYFEGHGCGTSFLIEVFYDFGYIGIVIFSFLIGTLTNALLRFLKKNIIYVTVSLNIIYNLCFLPRSNACSLFVEGFNPYYIFTMCVIILAYYTFSKMKEKYA
ncbi:MAG: O-antigen polysaccharide polymerase Wzy family protein [Erysipelotrichaceae bacterium]|nr:O-antigen polysaccharide polymerase Wzy family protein [Erysipelotrichaceae bacterium]